MEPTMRRTLLLTLALVLATSACATDRDTTDADVGQDPSADATVEVDDTTIVVDDTTVEVEVGEDSAPPDVDSEDGDTSVEPAQVVAAGVTIYPASGDLSASREVIARAVGDDLYLEVRWSAYRPGTSEAAPRSADLRVGLRVSDAGQVDRVVDLADVTLFGVEHTTSRPDTIARWYPEGAPATGSLGLRHEAAGLVVDLRLEATLDALQPGELDHVVALVDHVEAVVEQRAAYDGACTGHTSASYLPLQVGYEARFSEWPRVEGDCARVAGSGCRETQAGACGDGDRWLCRTCFDDACVAPAFQSECLPP